MPPTTGNLIPIPDLAPELTSADCERSVSYHTVPLPVWVALPGKDSRDSLAHTALCPPALLALEASSRRPFVSVEVFHNVGLITEGGHHSASILSSVPVISNLVTVWQSEDPMLPCVAYDVFAWVLVRSREVWQLVLGADRTQSPSASMEALDWCQTGTWYTQRPSYPLLRHDTRNEPSGDRGGKCSKFFGSYKTQGLTVGIMCCWCTHSVCYGFHCIPSGEGRNDVFSALFMRWEAAPDSSCMISPALSHHIA
ncbi:hypothetical protein JB92DRAFT_3117853 [Gautieria morchelliformis]|nr:hypothetical protein JB92DRAFT_3117853 [Gautieria morchelliformis]